MCVEYAAPCRRSTRARAWISAASAKLPGAVKSPEERPQAPAARASSSMRSMAPSSPAVTGRFSSPAVMSRSVLCPTWRITLTEAGGNAATYSAKVDSRNSSHGALEARYSRCIAARPGSTGATENPQLPTTSSVTPCRIFDSARGLSGKVKSECVWMSMNPGATTCPRASITRRAARAELGSTATMRPSSTATSASRPGPPLPSITWPRRISKSSIALFPGQRRSAAPMRTIRQCPVCIIRSLRPPHRKGRRDDLVHAVAVPAPLRHVRPEILRRLARLRIDLVHPRQSATLHQDLAVHDHGVHVAPGARVHQRLDGIRVHRRAQVVEVDQEDIGFGSRRQAAQVVAVEKLAAAQGGRVEHVAVLPRLIVRVGDLGEDRRPAELRHHVHWERVGADSKVHAGLEVALEGVQGHGHLRVLVRAVAHGGAALGEDAEIVAERIVRPRVRGGEDAVADQRAVVEEADVGQELDGRLPVLLHDSLVLDQIAARVRVHGHVELACSVLAGAQERLAARFYL